jgi:hypothetical protein
MVERCNDARLFLRLKYFGTILALCSIYAKAVGGKTFAFC